MVAHFGRETDPPPKIFKKKCMNDNVPSRPSYRETEMENDEEFWKHWIKNPLRNTKPGPRINPEAVWEIAEEVGYKWRSKVDEMVRTLMGGQTWESRVRVDGRVQVSITQVRRNSVNN